MVQYLLFFQSLIWTFSVWGMLLPVWQGRQIYDQLIVGHCAFFNQSKVFDVKGILGFIVLFAVVHCFTLFLQHHLGSILKKIAKEHLFRFFLYLFLPALIFFSLFFFHHEVDFFLLYLSAELLVLFYFLLFWSKKYFPCQSLDYFQGWLICFLLLQCSCLAMGIMQPLLSGIIFILLLLCAYLGRKKVMWQKGYLDFALILAQLPIPFLFSSLFSPYWDTRGIKVTCLVIGLIVCTWCELFYLYRYKKDKRPISALALIAFLFFVKQNVFPTGLADDYHWGEFLLPWWNSIKEGLIPFVDFTPARGLINYVPGFLSHIFFDGSARSYLAVWPIMQILYLIFGFYGFQYLLGQGTAFFIFLFYPLANGVMEIEILNVLLLIFLYRTVLQLDYVYWLLCYLGSCFLAILFAPGQGCMLTLAVLPAVGYGFIQYPRKKQLFGKAILFLFCIVVSFFLCSLPYTILWGAVKYVAEQGEINAIAHGIAWCLSWPNTNSLFELLRLSWLGVLLALMAYLGQSFKQKQFYELLLPFGLLLLLFFYFPRSLGRIDPGTLSRTGWTSYWAVCFILPLVWPKRSLLCFMILGAFLTVQSINTGCVQQSWPKSTEVLARQVAQPYVTDEAVFTQEQNARLKTMQKVLHMVLEPDETYLDLTNRGAQYVYLQKRMLTESVPYTMPHIQQQLRTVARLEQERPPLVLLSADNPLFDGGPLALRCYLLYRFVVLEGYRPFAYEGLIFAALPNCLAKLAEHDIVPVPAERIDLFKQSIGATDLSWIPVSWGQSADTLLANSLCFVEDIQKSGARYSFSPLAGEKAGIFVADYAGPTVEVMITAYDVLGQQIGSLQAFFSAGKVILPLDTDPGWLLHKNIAALEIRADEQAIALTNMKLYQRKEVFDYVYKEEK